MYSRQAILFPLILAAMLALLTFWINQAVEKNNPKMDGNNRHDYDYMLNNFYTTKTDLAGNLHYVLAATEMEHFPDDDSTVLQRPRFTQYTINKPYTQISGLRGYVSSGGEVIHVLDDVKVVRPAYEGRGGMQLLTDKLTIYPDEEVAKTDSPVVITQFPKTKIRATGMLFNKKEQTLTLGTISSKNKNIAPTRVYVHYERPLLASSNNKQTNLKNRVPKSTKQLNQTKNSSLSKTPNPLADNSKKTKRVRRTYE